MLFATRKACSNMHVFIESDCHAYMKSYKMIEKMRKMKIIIVGERMMRFNIRNPYFWLD